MIANTVAITLMEDLYVAATWDFNSTLIKGHALVSQRLQSHNLEGLIDNYYAPFIGIVCRKEEIEISGTTYIWPETPSDSIASFTCPNNRGFSVFRNCSTLGMWLPFDEDACGVVSQLLNGLNNSFTNVSYFKNCVLKGIKSSIYYGTIKSIVKCRDL